MLRPATTTSSPNQTFGRALAVSANGERAPSRKGNDCTFQRTTDDSLTEPPRPDIPAPEPENATRRQNSLAACCVNWRGAFGSLPFGKLPECNPLRNNTRRSRAIHLELGRAARVRVQPPTSVRHDCESRQFPYTAHPLHTEQVGHLLS